MSGVAPPPVLELENVTKNYGSAPPVSALQGVGFRISAGELVAIAGPSGSGKSTLLHLMGTLERPTSGRVLVTGLDVAGMRDRELAEVRATRIGFVFQQFFLAEHSTLIENVADGLLYAGVAGGERGARAADALAAVGLGHRLLARPTQLSGGERQRVAIARALVGAPAIVLADEPTGNLDSATGRQIMGLIEQLNARGATIVVITHEQAIADRCPRRIQLLDGVVVADEGRRAPAREAPAPTPVGAVTPRLGTRDLARVAGVGLRTRPLRAALSALGIAIGVAAIVAVLGLSASSQAGLLAEIDRLGTNLLTVTNGQTLFGQTAELPLAAPAMIARIGPVQQVQETGSTTADVFRSALIPAVNTNGLSVQAASLGLPGAVGTGVAQGSFLNAATAREPVAVLGAQAASLLGIDRLFPGERVWLGGMWFYVAGILGPAPLAPEIDSSVLVGFRAARRWLGLDGHPTTIYVRSDTRRTDAVHAVLAASANPEDPNEVQVSRPSAALTARADAEGALNSLFLALGAVSLLVGAIGVANTMLIGVLERRSEIGLRRALGATRGQIRAQFLAEAGLLALLGGVVGVFAGVVATVAYAHVKHWAAVVPTSAWAGGLAAAILIGAVAGLLPAVRAAQLSPTDALRSV